MMDKLELIKQETKEIKTKQELMEENPYTSLSICKDEKSPNHKRT